MSVYLGDFAANATVNFCWATNDKSGASVNPTTAGTIRVYKGSSNVEVTAPTGVTDTRGFDSLTGLHQCSIDLSANTFYATGYDYSVVLVGAVIDSETVNIVLATFSIQNRYMRGTDSAALASICTETRISKLDATISSRASASDYTSSRAGKLDNLDATISSRASGNVCTETRLAELDAANIPADIDSIKGKLPSKLYLTGTSNSDGDIQMNESTGDFNGTQKASINAEVDSAFDTAIPSNPTNNSINERIKSVDDSLPFHDKAAKILINKAIQNKDTGEIKYYDDDGQTIILTHTPVDEEATITRIST